MFAFQETLVSIGAIYDESECTENVFDNALFGEYT